jgi:hypothetical protein
MTVFNGIFPVLPGKEDAARAFAKEVAGPRADQFNDLQSRASISRETWTLQQTPMGSFVLVWFDGDVEAAFGDLATANDEFTVWFREQVKDVTGLDMAAPNEDPLPELTLDWSK